MNVQCPACGAATVKPVKGVTTITVRNEPIEVEVHKYQCPKCGEKFLAPTEINDPFAQAYRLYRTSHRILQPEEIRDFRRRGAARPSMMGETGRKA